MKLTFILITFVAIINANMIKNITTNQNTTILAPDPDIITIPIENKTVIENKIKDKNKNKMVMKCNYGWYHQELKDYKDVWKKTFKLISLIPPEVKTYTFTDKNRFRNSVCCTAIELTKNNIYVWSGRLTDLRSSYSYYAKLRKKEDNKRCLPLSKLSPNNKYQLIKCCRTLDPELPTGCNFFKLKIIPSDGETENCLVLVE